MRLWNALNRELGMCASMQFPFIYKATHKIIPLVNGQRKEKSVA